jgi:hypothetical protein
MKNMDEKKTTNGRCANIKVPLNVSTGLAGCLKNGNADKEITFV